MLWCYFDSSLHIGLELVNLQSHDVVCHAKLPRMRSKECRDILMLHNHQSVIKVKRGIYFSSISFLIFFKMHTAMTTRLFSLDIPLKNVTQLYIC